MKLTLNRIFCGPDYTIGKLHIDGEYFCDTLENTFRDLSREKKIPGKTCIPYGKYRVTLEVESPRFKSSASYSVCRGKLPRLLDVPHFEGILIHIGNYPQDTDGCILVGKNTAKGMLSRSKATFTELYKILKSARGPIYIDIQ